MKKAITVTMLCASILAAGAIGYSVQNANASEVRTTQNVRAGISGSVTINGQNYKWIETSWGKNRGMTFNPGQHVYQFAPNPHDDPWYNKNQQKFYNQAAAAIKTIGDKEKWTSTSWPSKINITVHGVDYTLNVY